MRTLISTTIMTLTMILPTVIHAEGLLYQLPKDGASVTFDLEGSVERNNVDGGTVTGSITMSSVGKATVEGEECRWLEFKTVFKQEGRERTQIIKILIPEKHLKKGASPLEHVIRGWVKRRDDDPQELKNPATGFLQPLLIGNLKETKKLENKIIESMLGVLQCEGLTGIKEFTLRLQIETKQNGQVRRKTTLNLKLADVAENAISALPDSQ